MNKIARFSVCDIRRIDIIKIELAISLQIFCMKFSESVQNWILTLLWAAIFDFALRPPKNLAAKFWIFPGKFMNLAADIEL